MNYIGIDLGTSAMKILLVDNKGIILKSVSKAYPLYMPQDGFSEQEPSDWLGAMYEGIDELLDGTDRTKVAGIGIGGQMHGLVVLDSEDEVIRPAILWNDNRTYEENDYLNYEIGKDVLSSLTGNISFTGFTASKLLWMYNHEREHFDRISKIMLPKDYLVYRLCGVHATDYSDASGMLLLDVKNKCYSERMLSICHVKKEWLPKLYESYETVGCLLPAVALRLGLGADVKVCAGAGDNAAAAIGTGTVAHGKCNISLGTSGTVFIASDNYAVDPNGAIHSFAHASGKYHLMGCMLSAASCNKWWMDEILRSSDYEKEQACIQRLGSNSVYFMPYLSGERSPHNDPFVRGAFVGLSMDTKREDMYQAVLEGVAYGLRDSIEKGRGLGISIESATLCGGGARSDIWRRILTNVLGITLEIPAVEEGPSYGAAILAMVSCGEYRDVYEAVDKLVSVCETYVPDGELVEKYDICYEKYKKLYPAMKEWYKPER